MKKRSVKNNNMTKHPKNAPFAIESILTQNIIAIMTIIH